MRVSFSVPLTPISGKHNFAIRLADALREKGIIVTNRKPDVNLVFVDGVRAGCKNVLRIDGVLMNTDIKYAKKNNKLKRTMRECDGVVYQNYFCKAAADVFLGKFNKCAVILNGAPLGYSYPEYKRSKPYIVSAARWRPHKRFKQTVTGFLDSGLHKSHDLLIVGELDCKPILHDSVIYLGKKSNETVMSIIGSCEFSVHLAWIDWCPNFVVESLSLKKNVLHSSCGGTKHIVQSSGIAVADVEWDFRPVRLYDPPPLPSDILASAYNEMLNLPVPDVKHIDIRVIADQYIDFFKKVLK